MLLFVFDFIFVCKQIANKTTANFLDEFLLVKIGSRKTNILTRLLRLKDVIKEVAKHLPGNVCNYAIFDQLIFMLYTNKQKCFKFFHAIFCAITQYYY